MRQQCIIIIIGLSEDNVVVDVSSKCWSAMSVAFWLPDIGWRAIVRVGIVIGITGDMVVISLSLDTPNSCVVHRYIGIRINRRQLARWRRSDGICRNRRKRLHICYVHIHYIS